VSGIASFQSGVPFFVTNSFRSDHQRSPVRLGRTAPNLVAGYSNNPTEGTFTGCAPFTQGSGANAYLTSQIGKNLGGPDLYYDPCAFSIDFNGDGVVNNSDRGFFGNLGRNTLTGPGYARFDFSLIKNTSLREGMNLQFRAELFNIANHPNFDKPANSPFGSNGRPGTGSIGQISSTVATSRQIQFGLKLLF
jgi:hypothetical protein